MTELENIVLGPGKPVHAPPTGATLFLERARRRFSFTAQVPWAFDLSWPAQTALGEFRGLGTTRVRAGSPARLQMEVEADVVTSVRATGEQTVVLSIFAEPGGAAARVSAQALLAPPGAGDPLLSALLNRHPLDWMRALMHGVGSPAWALMAREAQVWPSELDRVMAYWRELSCGAESALWRCAEEAESLDSIREWALRIVNGLAGEGLAGAVRASLAGDAGWAASPVAEWLESSAGLPLPLLDAPSAQHRLRTAAGLMVKLLAAGLEASVLRSFSEMAGDSVAEERLGPDISRVITERRLHEPAIERLSRSIHAEAQFTLGGIAARAAGQLIAAAGASWPLAEASFNLGNAEVRGRFAEALTGRMASFFLPAEGITAAPSLLALCATRPLTVQVALPLISQRRQLRAFSMLGDAKVSVLPTGRMEVLLPESPADPAQASDCSVIERTSLGALRAHSREPGTAECPLSCEDVYFLETDTPAYFWRRLLCWLGLPMPERPERRVPARLNISIPQAWTEIWHELPHSRDDAFPAVYSAIALELQQAMRRWIPYIAFKDAELYKDQVSAVPLLIYANSRPFSGGGKGDFTYARRGVAGLREAFQSAMTGFPETLSSICEELSDSGHMSHRTYNPARSRTLLATAFRQRRRFGGLLAADAFFLEEVFHLAASARELRQLASSPRVASRVFFRNMESSRATIGRRFRRLYGGKTLPLLPSVLMIEATAAACRAMGAQANVAATVSVEYEDGVVTHSNPAAVGLG